MARVERNTDRLGRVLTRAFPDISVSMQVIMNMERYELHADACVASCGTRIQERRGILLAWQSNYHSRRLCVSRNNKGRTRGDALCDLIDEIS